MRLFINIDHVATIRQARKTDEPDPVLAALACEEAGADGITAHLREDRRHIQDEDVQRLSTTIRSVLNLEMAVTDEMMEIALRLMPHQVTLVPERREEVTTEGGLDVTRDPDRLSREVNRLRNAGIRCSLFIDPDLDSVARSIDTGADAVELHTGRYANHPDDPRALEAIRRASEFGRNRGIGIHAGHGLTVRNVGPVAGVPEIEELNIGHSIVSRAVFVGIADAVREMRDAIRKGIQAGLE